MALAEYMVPYHASILLSIIPWQTVLDPERGGVLQGGIGFLRSCHAFCSERWAHCCYCQCTSGQGPGKMHRYL